MKNQLKQYFLFCICLLLVTAGLILILAVQQNNWKFNTFLFSKLIGVYALLIGRYVWTFID